MRCLILNLYTLLLARGIPSSAQPPPSSSSTSTILPRTVVRLRVLPRYVFRADKERILFSCTQSIFFYYNNTTLKMTDPTLLPPSSPSTPQPSAATNHGGRLSATILSVYDIPTDDKYGSESCPVPSYVSMSVLGREVRTGKPSAKHKSMNNFKFVSADKSSPGKCTLGVSIFNNMYLFNLVSCRDEIILIFQPLFSNKYT